MYQPIINAGYRFGRLVAIEPAGGSSRTARWRFQCDCGKNKIIAVQSVRAGRTQSCGCLRNERLRKALVTHGKTKTPEHKIWLGIINRCENPRNCLYYHYGARGVGVCDRWRFNFEAFLADMGPRPSPAHSVDRYPHKNGDYEPSNCRWATDKEQARNQTSNRIVVVGGISMTLAEACERAGFAYDTVWARLKRGWALERALSAAIRPLRPRR